MDKSGSGKESWIIRLDGLVSMSWSKFDGPVISVPDSKECHADRNFNEMCTFAIGGARHAGRNSF